MQILTRRCVPALLAVAAAAIAPTTPVRAAPTPADATASALLDGSPNAPYCPGSA